MNLYYKYVIKLKKYNDFVDITVPTEGGQSKAVILQEQTGTSLVILINDEPHFIAPISEIEVYNKTIIAVNDEAPKQEDADKDPEKEEIPLSERVDEVAKIIKTKKKEDNK